MATIQQLSEYARVAQASYARDLVAGADNTARYLVASDSDMARPQAVNFNANWAVLRQATPGPDGFSAVLLMNLATGVKVLSIAGTDPTSPADWITDLGVGLYGTVLDMSQYNSLESFYAQLLSSGKLGASEQIVVIGHSLGRQDDGCSYWEA